MSYYSETNTWELNLCNSYDDGEEEDDILDDHFYNGFTKYRLYRYFPKAIASNKREIKTVRGSWKAFPSTYTQKELDAACSYFWQYGDVIKVKRLI